MADGATAAHLHRHVGDEKVEHAPLRVRWPSEAGAAAQLRADRKEALVAERAHKGGGGSSEEGPAVSQAGWGGVPPPAGQRGGAALENGALREARDLLGD